MWHNHPFSQKTKQQKEQWGWRLEATGKGGWIKLENRVQAKQRGVFIKQGVRNPLPTILQFLFNLLHAGKHNLAYCITFVTLLYCNNCQLPLLKIAMLCSTFYPCFFNLQLFSIRIESTFSFSASAAFFSFSSSACLYRKLEVNTHSFFFSIDYDGEGSCFTGQHLVINQYL